MLRCYLQDISSLKDIRVFNNTQPHVQHSVLFWQISTMKCRDEDMLALASSTIKKYARQRQIKSLLLLKFSVKS